MGTANEIAAGEKVQREKIPSVSVYDDVNE
ncbi:MAG: hypothetical protein JWR89_4703 [Tardiphaga sp.]|nr:hypothetical protein [Tardiphaga sp.]